MESTKSQRRVGIPISTWSFFKFWFVPKTVHCRWISVYILALLCAQIAGHSMDFPQSPKSLLMANCVWKRSFQNPKCSIFYLLLLYFNCCFTLTLELQPRKLWAGFVAGWKVPWHSLNSLGGPFKQPGIGWTLLYHLPLVLYEEGRHGIQVDDGSSSTGSISFSFFSRHFPRNLR